MSGAWSMNCSCILDTPAIHGGRTRTSSLHMDVRSLAVPEILYPPLNATHEALIANR